MSGTSAPGLKPPAVSNSYRGAEAPLFHRGASIEDFFAWLRFTVKRFGLELMAKS